MRDGWHYRFGRWELWRGNRAVAVVQGQPDGTAQMTLDARKMWQVKHVRAASIDQAKRYGERWCAARLLPEVSTKAGAQMLRGQPAGEGEG